MFGSYLTKKLGSGNTDHLFNHVFAPQPVEHNGKWLDGIRIHTATPESLDLNFLRYLNLDITSSYCWSIRGAAKTLARWILDNPGEVKNCRVVDVGAGSGLVAIACAQAGAKKVTALDIDPIAKEVIERNAKQNGVGRVVKAVTIDARAFNYRRTDVVTASSVFNDNGRLVEDLLLEQSKSRRVLVSTADNELFQPAFNAGEVLGSSQPEVQRKTRMGIRKLSPGQNTGPRA
jgi:FkbM family methyltransferase